MWPCRMTRECKVLSVRDVEAVMVLRVMSLEAFGDG